MRTAAQRRRRALSAWLRNLFERWAKHRATHENEITLSHRCIYVLPTGFGLAWIGLFIGIWVGGANYDNNAARFLAWWLLSIMLIAPYICYRQLAGLRIQLIEISEACEGDEAHLTLSLSGHRSPISMQLADIPWQHVAAESSRFQSHFPVPSRGHYPCPTVRIECRLPFGLFRCWSVIRFKTEGLGYPRPIASSIVPTKAVHDEGAETNATQVHGKKGSDFDSLKRYEEGEPLARVDWKALAKTDQLYSKQYGTAVHSHRVLDIDALSGDVERRLGILCYWVLYARDHEQAVGLRLRDTFFAEQVGERHTRELLRALALFGDSK
jgi:uncharacterized protein (DUF58 family)